MTGTSTSYGSVEFVSATSERSLLTVLFPARGLRTTLAPNLRAAVSSLLDSLGVAGDAVAHEIAAMESVAFGRATDRRGLGSMNECGIDSLVSRASNPIVANNMAERAFIASPSSQGRINTWTLS